MKKFTKVATLLLALCMMLSLGSVAFAANIGTAGGTGTTPVTLTVEAPVFSVTVPTALAVAVSSNGMVTCATEAKITNNTKGQIEVTNVDITGQNGWTVVDYDDDMTDLPVNTSTIALKFNNITDVTDNGAALAHTIGTINGNASSANIAYAANLPIQSAAITTALTVANVVFTIGWKTADVGHSISEPSP